MTVDDLMNELTELKENGYGEARINLRVSGDYTGLDFVDLDEKPGHATTVTFS